jgi:integrase/recombinase XerC
MTQPRVKDKTKLSALVADYVSSALDGENTRRAYRYSIAVALVAMQARTLDDVTAEKLRGYRAALMAGELSPNSVRVRLSALRSFLIWARSMANLQLDESVIRLALRLPGGDVRRPYQVLSDPEIGELLRVVDSTRDRAILAVMLGGGLRVSETAGLDVVDVSEDGSGAMLLHIQAGKGQRSRTVPVQDDVAAVVKRYLEWTGRRMGDAGPLFLAYDPGASGRTSRRLGPRSIAFLVARAARKAGILAKQVSPHALRHTYALRALRHSGNVVAVAKLLGHAQVSTTQRYVDHLELAELRKTVPLLPTAGG